MDNHIATYQLPGYEHLCGYDRGVVTIYPRRDNPMMVCEIQQQSLIDDDAWRVKFTEKRPLDSASSTKFNFEKGLDVEVELSVDGNLGKFYNAEWVFVDQEGVAVRGCHPYASAKPNTYIVDFSDMNIEFVRFYYKFKLPEVWSICGVCQRFCHHKAGWLAYCDTQHTREG